MPFLYTKINTNFIILDFKIADTKTQFLAKIKIQARIPLYIIKAMGKSYKGKLQGLNQLSLGRFAQEAGDLNHAAAAKWICKHIHLAHCFAGINLYAN